MPLTLASDPPKTFREDRRGKPPRTDVDFAGLAMAYVAFQDPRRAASAWTARFGGSKRKWINLVQELKRRELVEKIDNKQTLSQKAMSLLGINLQQAEIVATFADSYFAERQAGRDEWFALGAFGAGRQFRKEQRYVQGDPRLATLDDELRGFHEFWHSDWSQRPPS